MAEWPLQSGLTLTALPNAAYWARRHTEDVLHKWGLGGSGRGGGSPVELVETVCLVVSELVTNGVKATGGLSAEEQAHYKEEPLSVPYQELANLGCVRLRLSYDRIRLLVEVWDRSEEVPVMDTPDFDLLERMGDGGEGDVTNIREGNDQDMAGIAEGGRGLFLVGALSERWGWYSAERGGKVVWADFLAAALASSPP